MKYLTPICFLMCFLAACQQNEDISDLSHDEVKELLLGTWELKSMSFSESHSTQVSALRKYGSQNGTKLQVNQTWSVEYQNDLYDQNFKENNESYEVSDSLEHERTFHHEKSQLVVIRFKTYKVTFKEDGRLELDSEYEILSSDEGKNCWFEIVQPDVDSQECDGYNTQPIRPAIPGNEFTWELNQDYTLSLYSNGEKLRHLAESIYRNGLLFGEITSIGKKALELNGSRQIEQGSINAVDSFMDGLWNTPAVHRYTQHHIIQMNGIQEWKRTKP